MRYLYDTFDNDGLGGNDMVSPLHMRRQALVSEQFYRNQGRFAGPFIDYTDLQKGIQSFNYSNSSYFSFDRMAFDVNYYVANDNKVTFTFHVNSFEFKQTNTCYDIPADLFTNAYLFRLDLYSINQVRENVFGGSDRMFYFDMPIPISIKYAPQSYFHTHHEIKDVVFMTDLMMDVFYGENKYKLDKNKINDDEYVSKVKAVQDKLIAIEEDFK